MSDYANKPVGNTMALPQGQYQPPAKPSNLEEAKQYSAWLSEQYDSGVMKWQEFVGRFESLEAQFPELIPPKPAPEPEPEDEEEELEWEDEDVLEYEERVLAVPTPKPLVKSKVTVEITSGNQFLVEVEGQRYRLHSEWQLAAFFTEMTKWGKLKHLQPELRTQTLEEWLAKGNEVKVLKPSASTPVPKDSKGKVALTLEELGL